MHPKQAIYAALTGASVAFVTFSDAFLTFIGLPMMSKLCDPSI
jgi:hypothetical protein